RSQGQRAFRHTGVRRRRRCGGRRHRARRARRRRGRTEPASGQHGRRSAAREHGNGRDARAFHGQGAGIVSFSETFIRRPVMTILLSASCVVAGLLAYGDIPIAALPKFDTPTIQVTAVLPGASPENMAASVATPLEKQFATISSLNTISSSSTLGN